MNAATEIFVYAWIGWGFLMLPVLALLMLTSWLLGKASAQIFQRLKTIYKLECIQYYFKKMETEGTHAFRNESKTDSAGGGE